MVVAIRMMTKKHTIIWISLLIIIALMGSYIWRSYSRQQELKDAFEKGEHLIEKTRFHLDTSHLLNAYSSNILPVVVNEIEKLKAETTFRAEEIDVIWVKVEEYNPPIAIIEVKHFYRAYTYDRTTKQITYDDPRPQRYWRLIKQNMLYEDGRWKIDKGSEFVDWSG